MRRRNSFVEEEMQALGRAPVVEGKEWREELVKLAQESPIILEDAMELVRRQSEQSKKITQPDYDFAISALEEKDKVSLSQWMVNEGIDIEGDEPQTPEEEALKEVGREPLEREGARSTNYLREQRTKVLGDWLSHFKEVGNIWDGVTLIELNRTTDPKTAQPSHWYSFEVDSYPEHSISINPSMGWQIVKKPKQTETGETEAVTVAKKYGIEMDRQIIDKSLLEDIFQSGGVKPVPKDGGFDELEREEAMSLLTVTFDYSEERAAKTVDNTANIEPLRALMRQYDMYKLPQKPARLSLRSK